MGYKYNFEKLEVWSDARNFVKDIYAITRNFSDSEKFGLSSQIQRAAISIASNIAEGVSRNSPKEQIRFIEVAYGSLMEVYCQLYLAIDLSYISALDFEKTKLNVDKISNRLNALARSFKERLPN